MKPNIFSALLYLLILPLSAFAMGRDELLREVDCMLNPKSYEMYRKLINIEPDGRKREFILFTARKGRDSVIVLFVDPPSEKDRATLRLGDNMWLYIPNVGKPMRITSLQSVIGGVFNNADILNLDYSTEYSVDKMTEEKGAYQLELKARNGTAADDRLRVQIDSATFAPTRIESYAASGQLIKTLHFKETKNFGNGIQRPSVIETDCPFHEGYKSVMIYANIKPRVFPDQAFTLNDLPRAGSHATCFGWPLLRWRRTIGSTSVREKNIRDQRLHRTPARQFSAPAGLRVLSTRLLQPARPVAS